MLIAWLAWILEWSKISQGRLTKFLLKLISQSVSYITWFCNTVTDKIQLKKEKSLFWLRIWGSITAGVSWWQECKVAGHVASTARNRRVNTATSLAFCFLFSPATQSLEWCLNIQRRLPTSIIQSVTFSHACSAVSALGNCRSLTILGIITRTRVTDQIYTHFRKTERL